MPHLSLRFIPFHSPGSFHSFEGIPRFIPFLIPHLSHQQVLGFDDRFGVDVSWPPRFGSSSKRCSAKGQAVSLLAQHCMAQLRPRKFFVAAKPRKQCNLCGKLVFGTPFVENPCVPCFANPQIQLMSFLETSKNPSRVYNAVQRRRPIITRSHRPFCRGLFSDERSRPGGIRS